MSKGEFTTTLEKAFVQWCLLADASRDRKSPCVDGSIGAAFAGASAILLMVGLFGMLFYTFWTVDSSMPLESRVSPGRL